MLRLGLDGFRAKHEKIEFETKSPGAMQWSSQYVTQKQLSWYGHVMRRDDKYVAKEITTMKV